MFSMILPSSLVYERSVKRLNVKEELKSDKIVPYICFAESEGAILIITYSGMCLKYTLSVYEQNPQTAPTSDQTNY